MNLLPIFSLVSGILGFLSLIVLDVFSVQHRWVQILNIVCTIVALISTALAFLILGPAEIQLIGGVYAFISIMVALLSR